VGNDSANRTGQGAPFPTVIVHPEDPLDVSIERAVFDELDSIADISKVPEGSYKTLAEKLFLMCQRKPKEHRECFEATIHKLRKPNVLGGNVWSE
jgi:hypothetical protein